MSLVSADDEAVLTRAIAALDAGELIVIPGDVCYLVAADALDDAAVEKVFLAKHRGADRALTVAIGGYQDLHHVAYGGGEVRALAEHHWPGPASIVMRARPWLPDAVTGGAEDVAVTVPRQPFAQALAQQFGPLVVAAARRSGMAAPPLDVMRAREALGAEVALYVDAGVLAGGRAERIRVADPAA